MQTFNTKYGLQILDEAASTVYGTPPVGTIMMYVGSTAPEGWLLCDGSTPLRADYPDLNSVYQAESYPFGSGNGTTTFTLPDLKSRFPIGAGTGAGLTARTFATKAGAESHTIGAANLGTHTHTLGGHTHDGATGNVSADHTHGVSGNTGIQDFAHQHNYGNHNHGLGVQVNAGAGSTRNSHNSTLSGTLSAANITGGSSTSNATSANHNHSVAFSDSAAVGSGSLSNSDSHNHSFTTGGPSVANVGTNASLNNALGHMNPFVCLNFIVKY